MNHIAGAVRHTLSVIPSVGDNSHLTLWIVLMAAALIGMFVLLFCVHRRGKYEKDRRTGRRKPDGEEKKNGGKKDSPEENR